MTGPIYPANDSGGFEPSTYPAPTPPPQDSYPPDSYPPAPYPQDSYPPAGYPQDSYPPAAGYPAAAPPPVEYPPSSAPPASPGPYPPGYGSPGGYASGAGYPVSPAYPVSGYATSPPPMPFPPVASGAMMPAGAGFGPMPIGVVDPMTGQVWSDKSRASAGLLQLLPALFFAVGGIGRLYAGNTALGVTQICLTVVGWFSFWCGFALILPWFISGGLWLWFVIDGIVILAGRPVDGQGRPLRS